MVASTTKITITEKYCGLNQTQIDYLRLLTSSSSSASLKIMYISSTYMARALNYLKLETA